MAKKNPKYTKNTTTKMTVSGTLDTANGNIIVDGEVMSLATLFADFNNTEIEISAKITEEEELDTPEDI